MAAVCLDHFFKADVGADPGAALQALMRAVMVRTQFLPAVRYAIGWRGLKQCPAEAEGWTAKIAGAEGVFGLFFMSAAGGPERAIGRFGLCYFPDPEEPLVERLALAAAAATQRKDYQPLIRDFLHHSELASLFGIGTFLLSLRLDRRGMALAMQSASALRSRAKDGVHLPRDGKTVELVPPGGFDQDFPAFETAQRLFDVLAASVTYNLEQAPVEVVAQRFTAIERVYDAAGEVVCEHAPDLWNGLLALGWGEEAVDTVCAAVSAAEGPLVATMRGDGPENAPPGYRDKLWWRAHQLKGAASIDKKTLGVDERPPLILLTGFLGSGKTSFLQHFIEYQTQRSRFVAVIQNEIGPIGLDGKLLDYTVTEIDEGCVCCSLAGNLKRAVQGILSEFHPDTIIVETTGAANPLNLLDEMSALGELVRFDCTLTVVDALNVDRALAEHPIARDQIRAADVLMLNKKDLVAPAWLSSLAERLQQLNPRALLFMTEQGDLNPAFILEVEERSPYGSRARPAAVHPGSHLDDGLWAKSIRLERPVDRDAFFRAVGQLPPAIFRMKGVLEFSDSPRLMLFQYVAGRHELSVFPRPSVPDRFLTVIGKGGDPERAVSAIQAALSAPP